MFLLWLKYTKCCIFWEAKRNSVGCVFACSMWCDGIHMCLKLEQIYNNTPYIHVCIETLHGMMLALFDYDSFSSSIFDGARNIPPRDYLHSPYDIRVYIELIHMSVLELLFYWLLNTISFLRNYSFHYETEQLWYFNYKLLIEVIKVSERKRLQKLHQSF